MPEEIPLAKQYELCMEQGRKFLWQHNYGKAAYSFGCARRVAGKLHAENETESILPIWGTLEERALSLRRTANQLKYRRRKERKCRQDSTSSTKTDAPTVAPAETI